MCFTVGKVPGLGEGRRIIAVRFETSFGRGRGPFLAFCRGRRLSGFDARAGWVFFASLISFSISAFLASIPFLGPPPLLPGILEGSRITKKGKSIAAVILQE